jgi:crotonobetainyl-CoA:carnitine CoA-transferase CaiB-like acyl-CoA transferase
MVDAALSLLGLAAGSYAVTGQSPPTPDMLTGALACYGMYRCADDRWLTCGGLEPKFFARMLELMGRSDLAPWQHDPQRQDDLREALTREFGSRPRDHWLALLEHEDTCVGPVLDVAEAMVAAAGRGDLVVQARLADGTAVPVVPAVPWLAGSAASEGATAPALGADTDALLAEAGVPREQIAQLRAAGVVA